MTAAGKLFKVAASLTVFLLCTGGLSGAALAAPTEAAPPTRAEASETILPYTEADVAALAKTVYNAARGVDSDTEKAAVVWCVLNRVDSARFHCSSILEAIKAPGQFPYRETSPVTEEIETLVRDVLGRWVREKNSETDVGRVLPHEYLFFRGDGKRNHFTTDFMSGTEWDPDSALAEASEAALPYTEEDVAALAKTVYGEARGVDSDTEKAAVVWCVLNRVDSDQFRCDSIIEAVTAPCQFSGYCETHPVTEEIETLVRDVLDRWAREKDGETDVGRVLPPEYLFFRGDGRRNHFTTNLMGGTEWDPDSAVTDSDGEGGEQ